MFHENGLPEWLKNASDAYVASGVPFEKRVIVLILEAGRKVDQPSISCLDFVGITSKVIEEDFRIWADPEAARRRGQATAVQGGHCNGGKCYMTQMFDGGSVLPGCPWWAVPSQHRRSDRS